MARGGFVQRVVLKPALGGVSRGAGIPAGGLEGGEGFEDAGELLVIVLAVSAHPIVKGGGVVEQKLVENANSLMGAVVKAKPAAAKGKYVKSVTICSTMGPGVSLDTTPYNLKAV